MMLSGEPAKPLCGSMIPAGVDLCTTYVGCVAGIPLIVAGVAAVGVGGALIWSGVKFTEVYVNDVFVVTP
jgi:hypothetical protein